MTVRLFLYAAPPVMWALLLGMISAFFPTDPRRRRFAAILFSIWLVLAAVRLWHEPAIEPRWLQYLLLVMVPAVLGFGLSLLVRHSRRPRDARGAPDASAPETSDGGPR